MYRRHLRMVLVRDVESNGVKSEFLHRVASIPVVYLAWNIAAETYRNIKTSNKLLKVSLTTTERAAFYITKPFLKKFAKQLRVADHLASKGLETLQEILPSIINQQKKLYRHTKNIYDETVESGLKKYEVVKHIGTSKVVQLKNEGSQRVEEFLASPYGEICELALDFFFDAGDMYVDYYLPPLGDERPGKLFGDRGREPTWKRAEQLRNRFYERIYKHSMLKIQRFRLQTKLFIAKIYHFNMYQYLVEVSTVWPVTVATVIRIFSSFEDMVAFLISLYASHPRRNDSIV